MDFMCITTFEPRKMTHFQKSYIFRYAFEFSYSAYPWLSQRFHFLLQLIFELSPDISLNIRSGGKVSVNGTLKIIL